MAYRIIATALLVVCASVAAAADFDAGVAAYNQGDYVAALDEFRPLAEQGDADAQYNLGVMYGHGKGVPQDFAEAAVWYRKAAEQGHAKAQYNLAKAQYNLGIMYDLGKGVPQDFAEAVAWYRKAAEQGLANAQYNLGVMYEDGMGVSQDYVTAYAWYNLAAAQGNENARELRTMLLDRMTREQVAEAQKLSRELEVQINEN